MSPGPAQRRAQRAGPAECPSQFPSHSGCLSLLQRPGLAHLPLWGICMRACGGSGCTWHPRESPFPAGARGYPGSVSGGCLSDSRVSGPLQQVVQPQGPIQLWGPWLTGLSGQHVALGAALSPWPGACLSDVSVCQS